MRNKLKNILGWKLAPYILLLILISAYFIIFLSTSFSQYNRFWYGNFDLGIPDQGIWLLSQNKEPFVTARGMHIFADHSEYIKIFVAPVFWLWNDAKALILLQTLALSLAAIPLFFIAKKLLKSNRTSLIIVAVYLLYPALQFLNLDQGYHSEAFIIPMLFTAHYFLLEKKYTHVFVLCLFSLLIKEEIALTIALYGAYIYFRHNKKLGAIVSITTVIWLIVLLTVIFPMFSSRGFLYFERTTGNSPFKMISNVFDIRNAEYIAKLFGPLGFTPFFDAAIVSAGSLFLNLANSWSYSHEIQYHYTAAIIPVAFIAMLHFLSKRKNIMLWLLVILSLTLISNYIFGPGEVSLRETDKMFNNVAELGKEPENVIALKQMISSIPQNASVSASYNIMAFLTHRERIYMYPVPFKSHMYGASGNELPEDRFVDYIIISRSVVPEKDMIFMENYTMTSRHDDIEMYKKTVM
ncbi:MAG: DUF2079 domain-containing protein [Candidatus Aenigmarchaeota archaeon]|nr:DUF2079 domain-containing protein [Candidatus Aenigmarchaeota archaeon]